jgi:hypothetical protein
VISIEIPGDDFSYYFCDQDMTQYRPPAFPAIPSNQPKGGEWMTSEQNFAQIYGFTSVAVIACVVLWVLNSLRQKLQGFFVSGFEVRNGALESSWPLPTLLLTASSDLGTYSPNQSVCLQKTSVTSQIFVRISPEQESHLILTPSCFVILAISILS